MTWMNEERYKPEDRPCSCEDGGLQCSLYPSTARRCPEHGTLSVTRAGQGAITWGCTTVVSAPVPSAPNQHVRCGKGAVIGFQCQRCFGIKLSTGEGETPLERTMENNVPALPGKGWKPLRESQPHPEDMEAAGPSYAELERIMEAEYNAHQEDEE